ncbi:hypothetical protein [Actinomadura sp. DC4]|uniref:hypothetical protein n=1 Tax=Actinomadura sp. DC4 TaxID=3055069 RepID=UPI0025B175A7|nr:hypothetical protein [Actinomadura sp. DC4]MDN3355630.1 hypothetical protein [Actinomadura sp. DC4]
MPRRRPKALRAERWRPPPHVPVRRLHGLSAQTRVAIRRLEHEHLFPNAVAIFLHFFDEAFRLPYRYLNAPGVSGPTLHCAEVREKLDLVLLHLPEGARTDLGRLVAQIDAETDRRTFWHPAWVRDWRQDRG